MYRTKLAPIAKPKAFTDPLVDLEVTKTSFAIYAKLDVEDMFAVFAIILKKTISNGVMTIATTADEAIEANKMLMKRSLFPSLPSFFSRLLICETGSSPIICVKYPIRHSLARTRSPADSSPAFCLPWLKMKSYVS